MSRAFYTFTAFALCVLLSACAGGGGEGGSSGDSVSVNSSGDSVSVNDVITPSISTSATKSSFSLRLTDAPVDDMSAVVIEVTAVALRNKTGTWINYPFPSPKSIDVLQLQGTLTADLLVDVEASIGRYDEIRLLLSDAPMTNYLDLGTRGLIDLKVPGGELKIKGDFTVFKSLPTSLVIDFDLRQSIKRNGNSGKYSIKPVLRLADNENAGHLRGNVSPLLLSSATACSDDNVDTFNAVYVYEGHDVIPDDINQNSDLDVSPFTTTIIKYQPLTSTYRYDAAFLPLGDYTIAFTCNANLDNLDDGNDDLKFFNTRNVTVTIAGKETIP